MKSNHLTSLLEHKVPIKLIRDDCLNTLKDIPTESIDLIYADPPFNSNKYYNTLFKGEDREIERIAFVDKWKGGMESYIHEMNLRVKEFHRVLTKRGSLYLHCDQYASHYLKVDIDTIFGRNTFRAVVEFQVKHQLKPDGIVGRLTNVVLNL